MWRFPALLLALSFGLWASEISASKRLALLQESYLDEKNIWLSAYKNIKNYQEILFEIESVQQRLKSRNLSVKTRIESELRLDALRSKLEIYSASEKSFADIMRIPSTQASHQINLFTYLTGSYESELHKYQKLYTSVKNDYEEALDYLKAWHEQASALLEIAENDHERTQIEHFASKVQGDILYLESSKDIINGLGDRLKLYENLIHKSAEEYRNNELPKVQLTIAILLGASLLIYFTRRFITRHIHDDERRFRLLKTMNILFLVSVIIILLFSFSSNILHAITLLGFLGAGIAVSLKELVQNFAGWLYLSFSGLMKVGDRILIHHETHPIIGDSIAITATKIVLYEGINHTTASELKRAGRIVMIPNHYVFNHPIFNYTLESLKTLYDLIEIDIEPTSDLARAKELAMKVILERTERYIELGRKQYKALREKYDLRRNMDFSPQIHFVIANDNQAIRMQMWFLSPYRDIMQVRSEITQEFLTLLQKEEHIHLKA